MWQEEQKGLLGSRSLLCSQTPTRTGALTQVSGPESPVRGLRQEPAGSPPHPSPLGPNPAPHPGEMHIAKGRRSALKAAL